MNYFPELWVEEDLTLAADATAKEKRFDYVKSWCVYRELIRK